MPDFPFGAAFSAGSSLIGDILGFVSSNNQQQMQRDLAIRNEELQREFAQNAVQWKAADARAAGIHPIFAMGAQTHSYAPVSMPSSDSGRYLSSMGQNIGRAALAAQDFYERQEATRAAAVTTAAQVDLITSQADLAKAQTRAWMTGQVGPPFPRIGSSSPGGGNSGDVVQTRHGAAEMKPTEVTTANPTDHSTASGPLTPVNRLGLGSQGQIQLFANDKLITDMEIDNPVALRWLWTELLPANLGLGTRNHLEMVKKHILQEYPDAVGFRYSRAVQGYLPIYAKDAYKFGHTVPHPMQTDNIHPKSRYRREYGKWPINPRFEGNY